MAEELVKVVYGEHEVYLEEGFYSLAKLQEAIELLKKQEAMCEKFKASMERAKEN